MKERECGQKNAHVVQGGDMQCREVNRYKAGGSGSERYKMRTGFRGGCTHGYWYRVVRGWIPCGLREWFGSM